MDGNGDWFIIGIAMGKGVHDTEVLLCIGVFKGVVCTCPGHVLTIKVLLFTCDMTFCTGFGGTLCDKGTHGITDTLDGLQTAVLVGGLGTILANVCPFDISLVRINNIEFCKVGSSSTEALLPLRQ